MDARQMTARAEAPRLTRQGRLLEATSLIQRTLAGPALTQRSPDAPSAREGTRPRRILPRWIPRRRTVPGRSTPDLHRPETPGVKGSPAPFDVFSYTHAASSRG